MDRQKATIRYAKTLFQYARQNSALDATVADMKIISSVFETTGNLEAFFANPLHTDETVERVLRAGFADGLSPLTFSFIQLMHRKKRLDLLRKIPEAFIALYEEHENIVRATVRSALRLSKQQMGKLRKKLMTAFKAKDCILENLVDKQLVAGMQVRIGDLVIDSNIKSKLQLLRRKLAS